MRYRYPEYPMHNRVKEDIVPSIFPNCPTYLTNSVAARSTAMAPAFLREAKTNQRKQDMLKKQLELDLVKQLSDMETNFRNKFRIEPSLEKTQLIENEEKLCFYNIEIAKNEANPFITYSLIIDSDLVFTCFKYESWVSHKKIGNFDKKENKIHNFTEIISILKYLQYNDVTSLYTEEIKYYIEKLKLLKPSNDHVRSKLLFLLEQLELSIVHDNHRRYSSELLYLCVIWENTSSNLYKQIRDEGILSLPSQRYIQKLTSAISVDTGITKETLRYLEARIKKITEMDKVGTLIIDEVYVSKRCEFTRFY